MKNVNPKLCNNGRRRQTYARIFRAFGETDRRHLTGGEIRKASGLTPKACDGGLDDLVGRGLLVIINRGAVHKYRLYAIK